MKKKLVILIGVGIVVLVSLFFGFKALFKQKEEVHYHAGFQIYVDGKLQDFSDVKYMFIKPCSKEDTKENEETEQIEKAHLHDNAGDVVHIEAEGARWKDLLQNIHFKIDPSKPVEGYIDDKKVDGILDYSIKPYHSLVIFIGRIENTKEKLKRQVSRRRIEEVGRKSEACGEEK